MLSILKGFQYLCAAKTMSLLGDIFEGVQSLCTTRMLLNIHEQCCWSENLSLAYSCRFGKIFILDLQEIAKSDLGPVHGSPVFLKVRPRRQQVFLYLWGHFELWGCCSFVMADMEVQIIPRHFLCF